MKKQGRTYRVGYEEALRYTSKKPAGFTDSFVGMWCALSLPPLLLNLGTREGLLCWGICGLLLCPVVGKLFGSTSMVTRVSQGITGAAFINAIICLMIPQWVLLLLYLVLAVGSYAGLGERHG